MTLHSIHLIWSHATILLITVSIIPQQCIETPCDKLRKSVFKFENTQDTEFKEFVKSNVKAGLYNIKVILFWFAMNGNGPFRAHLFETGQKLFERRRCPIRNCFITDNRNMLPSVTDYDVIVFAKPASKQHPIPAKRLANQKYVFASSEAADMYPICGKDSFNFFNWTWTYKLDSDLYLGYIIVRNKYKQVIGPKILMHWMDIKDMHPVGDNVRDILSKKSIAAAWFISYCTNRNGRQRFSKEVTKQMRRYGLSLHIYGRCGDRVCGKDKHSCLKLIERDYYFYFAFENSFSDDYVTEKLLTALQHYAVPVVYGSANYTRFMPDGIYLDGLKLGPKSLVERMAHLIQNKEKYYEYFKWRNHYSYHRLEDFPNTDVYCKLCEKVNNRRAMPENTVYEKFPKWFSPLHKNDKICPYVY